MSDTPALRKARGAFFTPPEISQFLADWAIRTPDDRVLEPACGDAEFMLAAGRRLRALGGGLLAGANLVGVELHEASAEEARRRVREAGFPPDVRVGDFFNQPIDATYDAVIGNPPYVRYQSFSGAGRRRALEAALAEGVRLTKLTSAWAPFVVQSARFLNPAGRLGLVLPAELLSVGYAAEVRRYLLERFAEIRLVLFEELVFPGVEVEVVLLLAEGEGGAPHFEVHQARNLSELGDLDNLAWTPFNPEGGKWLPALMATAEMEVYQDVLASPSFARLSDWGDTYLGIVTGANRYFTVSAEEAADRGLKPRELLKISPPGSRHLRGLTFTDKAWEELARAGRPVYLLYPQSEPSAGARRYIEAGETTGVHKGYKCRIRDPWWRVPLVDRPDILLTYMDRDRPRLVTNRAKVHALNSLYGIRLHAGLKRLGQDLLPIACLNSVTLLGAEVVGRAYGGGLLKLEPKEANRLPVPSEALILQAADDLRALRPQLSSALRQGDLDNAVKLVDRVLLLRAMGMDHADLEAIRSARATLFGRRQTRSNANATS